MGQENRAKQHRNSELELVHKRVKKPDKLDSKNKILLQQLRDSEIQYRRLFEAAQDGILILDGKTGKIREANQFIINMLGYSKDELVGRKLWEIGAFVDIEKSKNAYEELQEKNYVRYEDIPLESRNGKMLEVEFVSNAYLVKRERVIQCNIRDISERKQFERKLAFSATHDALTGLPNRTLLYDRFRIAAANADRMRKKLALMSLDLDRFKTVNDTLGHAMGDNLLKAVAERLTGTLRRGDTVARIGGDEFLLLLPGIDDKQHIVTIAEKILHSFRRRLFLNGHKMKVTTSIGIVIYPDDDKNIDTLIKHADKSLYRAKEDGRDNYKFYLAE